MSNEVQMTNDQECGDNRVILSAAVLGGAKDLCCGWFSIREWSVTGVRDPSLRVSTRSAQDDIPGM